jgi:hypothetical protein
MPWQMKAMKGVVSCDKLRGGANNLRSGDARMGKPLPSHVGRRKEENEFFGSIPFEPTRRTETSKYPEEKKANAIPKVAASEMGTA